MATKGNTNPERIARWKVMTAGLKPQIAELPMLTGLHAELESVTLQSEDLDVRHEALKSEMREVNRLRGELVKKGDDLRNRLAAALQTVHGFQSEKLIEYGVQPRRPRIRQARKRRGASEPAPAPAEPTTSAAE